MGLESQNKEEREVILTICGRKANELHIAPNEMLRNNFHLAIMRHINKSNQSDDLRYSFLVLQNIITGTQGFPSFEDLDDKGFDWNRFYHICNAKLKSAKDINEQLPILKIIQLFGANKIHEEMMYSNRDIFPQIQKFIYSSNYDAKLTVARTLHRFAEFTQEEYIKSNQNFPKQKYDQIQISSKYVADCLAHFRNIELVEPLLDFFCNMTFDKDAIVSFKFT